MILETIEANIDDMISTTNNDYIFNYILIVSYIFIFFIILFLPISDLSKYYILILSGILLIKNYGFYLSNFLYIVFILKIKKNNLIQTLPVLLACIVLFFVDLFIEDINNEIMCNYRFIFMLLISICLINKIKSDKLNDELKLNIDCITIPTINSKSNQFNSGL